MKSSSTLHSTNPDHWHRCEICSKLTPIVGQTMGGRLLVGCGHPQQTFILRSRVPLRDNSQSADFEDAA